MNIHTPAGLDAFIDHLESGASIILAGMGAGPGQVASEWFDAMYEDVSATGARFTAAGVITPDRASVESVLVSANRLQDRVQYVVVQNATSSQSSFSYWDSAEQAMRFRESLSPTVVRMEFRLAELESCKAVWSTTRAGSHAAELGRRTEACLDHHARGEVSPSQHRRLLSRKAFRNQAQSVIESSVEKSKVSVNISQTSLKKIILAGAGAACGPCEFKP